MHVAQLESQALQILLSATSPYSFEFLQDASHFLLLLFPQLGLTQAVMQLETLRNREEPHDKQLVEVPGATRVAQVKSQVLQIRSVPSPYSFVFAQLVLQVLVPLFPHWSDGHFATQLLLLKYKGASQEVQALAELEQVLQTASQFLHTLPADGSPYSLGFEQLLLQVLVELFPQVGGGQAE